MEVRRQLQKALLTKEEGGDDEGGYLSMLLRNIVNNLEITLKGVSPLPSLPRRSTSATRIISPTRRSSPSA